MLVIETTKVCFKCGETKPLSMFYKHPRMADGHINKCKECNKKDVRENYATNIDYYTEYEVLRRDTENRIKSRKSRMLRVQERYKVDKQFRETIVASKEKWADSNKHKREAHHAVSNSVRDGRLFKPNTCEHCSKTGCTIYGHHWSYLQENWLNVMWLCSGCHGKEHRKNFIT